MLIFENDFAPLVEMLRKSCPCIERYVTVDEKIPAADLTYEELLSAGKPERVDYTTIDENSIAELFYTSGSTGTPKGVMLSHRTLYLHGLSVATTYNPDDDPAELHTIPLFHANGWGRPQTCDHGGAEAGDGAALRSHHGLPADPGRAGHGDVAGSHHGQCAAELRRISASTISRA